jgi:hypothetical protein
MRSAATVVVPDKEQYLGVHVQAHVEFVVAILCGSFACTCDVVGYFSG